MALLFGLGNWKGEKELPGDNGSGPIHVPLFNGSDYGQITGHLSSRIAMSVCNLTRRDDGPRESASRFLLIANHNLPHRFAELQLIAHPLHGRGQSFDLLLLTRNRCLQLFVLRDG